MKKQTRKVGRPPKSTANKRQKVTLTMPPNVLEDAFAKADALGISMSSLVEMAVRRQLKEDEESRQQHLRPLDPPDIKECRAN